MSRDPRAKSGDAEIDRMFSSIAFEARFENHTSRTSVRDPGKVEIVEFGEHAMTLEVPAKSVNVEHQITLEITRVGVGPEDAFEFSSTGKVVRVDELGKDRIRIEFKMLQFDEASWQKYLDLYSARQEEITQFLMSVNR